MDTFQRVFAAIDFSPSSDDALQQAYLRTKSSGARLAVCHVVPNELRTNLLFPHISRITALQLPRELNQIAEAAAERVKSVTGLAEGEYDLLVDDGTPQALILAHAEDWHADLIEMGSHGQTSAADELLGSVTTSVIRHAHCAVAIARRHKQNGTISRILAGTDFSDQALPALRAAASEAERTGAALTVLHSLDLTWSAASYPAMAFGGSPFNVSAEQMEDLKEVATEHLEKHLAELDIKAEALIVTGEAGTALNEAASTLNANMIVVGTVGRTGIRRALLGSVAESVARGAPCSVLIARAHV